MSTIAVAPVAAPTALPIGRLASVGAVIFFANAALLVLQLVAGRLLAPFIGSSLETWTSTIGVFLTGIALGNAYGGKIADRYPKPLTLAILLAIGAVAALWMLVFPLLLNATGMHKVIPLGPRIPILTAFLCLPAGFVLSLLTPLAIKLGLPDVSQTGRVAGFIFAISTLGCLIGNYLTGFVLIPWRPINTLVFASVGVLVLLALGTLLVSLISAQNARAPQKGVPKASPSSSGTATSVESPETAFSPAFTDIRRAYLIVFLASFCGMTLELTASRVLAQALGVSLFTWTGVIGVMLAGTALGNFTGGQLADRPKQTVAWLAGVVVLFVTTALGAALSMMVAYNRELPVEYVLGIHPDNWARSLTVEWQVYRDEVLPVQLPRLQTLFAIGVGLGAAIGMALAFVVVRLLTRMAPAMTLHPRFVLTATLCLAGAAIVFLFVSMAGITRYNLFDTWEPIAQVMVWTFSLFFLPMFMLGLVSPQVIRLAVPDVAHAGRVAGRVYAWSTVGAIVGTFAAGYMLLSTFGMFRTLLGMALLVTLTSLLVTNIWSDTRRSIHPDDKSMPEIVAGASALLYLFSIVLGGVAGGFILTRNTGSADYLANVESNYYTIRVGRHPIHNHESALSLNLDRLLHSVVDPNDPGFLYYTHEHIQMEFLWQARAVSPQPKALVIGGGGYTFPRYAVETMPEAEIDVVEIDPKVTQVARKYLGLKEYSNLRALHMDGRQFVAEKAAPGSYDVIIQDAVNDLSVPAHLMTKEYNDAIKVALKPQTGVYLLTIIDSIGDGKLWKAAMATLAKTFPEENIVLLTAEAPEPAGTREGKTWDRTRRVMVIYASDSPFDMKTLWNAVPDRISADGIVKVMAHGGNLLLELPNSIASAVVRFVVAVRAEPVRQSVVRTVPIPSERLKPYLMQEPGVVLTDQYCPIDNLMAEVFRLRNKQ